MTHPHDVVMRVQGINRPVSGIMNYSSLLCPIWLQSWHPEQQKKEENSVNRQTGMLGSGRRVLPLVKWHLLLLATWKLGVCQVPTAGGVGQLPQEFSVGEQSQAVNTGQEEVEVISCQFLTCTWIPKESFAIPLGSQGNGLTNFPWFKVLILALAVSKQTIHMHTGCYSLRASFTPYSYYNFFIQTFKIQKQHIEAYGTSVEKT